MTTVTTERSVYREVCKSSRQAMKDSFTSGGNFSPPAPGSMVSPVSNDIKIHYSFDMAQQVHSKCILFYYLHSNRRCTIPVIHFSPAQYIFLPQKMCRVRGMLWGHTTPGRIHRLKFWDSGNLYHIPIHYPIDHIPCGWRIQRWKGSQCSYLHAPPLFPPSWCRWNNSSPTRG